MSPPLADLDLGNPWESLGRLVRDASVILLPLLGVCLVVVLWAAFLRKRPRHRFHAFGRRAQRSAPPAPVSPASANSGRKHHHRRRREHRARNPTLAQTGGLPPARPERPPEPFP